jgi:hypothetical protein
MRCGYWGWRTGRGSGVAGMEGEGMGDWGKGELSTYGILLPT